MKQSTHHPAWAHWTWPHAWLPEAFHYGGDQPVWQWLQSRPYVPGPLSEGAHGNCSVDGIALGIGCLLRDLEAAQFSEEIYSPQHVTDSQVNFAAISSTIHPAIDGFSQIIKDHNNPVSDNNSFRGPET